MKLVPIGQPPAKPYADQPSSPSLDNFLATGDPSRPAKSFRLTPVEQAPAQPGKPTFAGLPVPDDLQPVASAVLDASGAFNQSLVKAIGGTADMVNELLGKAGLKFQQTGDATKALMDATDEMGLQTKRKPVSRIAAAVGHELLPQLLTAAAMFAGAGPLAGTIGEGGLASGARAVGEALRSNPGAAIAGSLAAAGGGPLGSEAGAAVGRSVAENNGTTLSPQAEANYRAMGNLAGQTLAGGLGAAAEQMFRGIPASARSALAPVGQDFSAIKNRIGSFFERAFQTMHTDADTVTAAQSWRGALRKAYANADKEISGMWKGIDMNRTMEAGPIKAIIPQMLSKIKNPVAENPDLPMNLINAIRSLPAFPELANVRAILKQAQQASRVLAGTPGDKANASKKAFINDIVTGIKDATDAAFPDDQQLKAATAMTKWLHDTFDRGALAPFAQRTVANEAGLRDAVPGANRVLQSEGGGRLNANLQSAQPVTRGVDVAQPADQFIKANLQEIADTKGPTAGVLWFNRPYVKRFVSEYPAMEAQAQQFNDRIKPALDLSKVMRDGKFLQTMQEKPEAAAGRVFSSVDPERAADAVVRTLKQGGGPDVEDAMGALQTATIRHILDQTGANPTAMDSWMSQAAHKAALEKIFPVGGLSRFQAIVKNAAGIAAGQETSPAKLARKTAGVGGRMIGSAIFTKLLPIPGNTLIKATAGAKLGRAISERMLKVYQPEDLIRLAVVDPQWEQLLMSRNPTTLEDVKRVNTLLGRIAATIHTGASGAPDQTQDQQP